MNLSHLKCVQVARFVRRLRGGSQPILIEGVNGVFYALKFSNNPQGPNVLFNEVAGIELYRKCRLPAPRWEYLYVTKGFIERNRECWIDGAGGKIKPEAGLCFGTRFLGHTHRQAYEILPGAYFGRIRNRRNFWFAWFVDAICAHADNRQAIFLQNCDHSIDKVFLDFGNLFGGARGSECPKALSSLYLDKRIYPEIAERDVLDFKRMLHGLSIKELGDRVKSLPEWWQTDSAAYQFAAALDRLQSFKQIDSILNDLLSQHVIWMANHGTVQRPFKHAFAGMFK